MKGIHIVPCIEKEASGPTYSVVRLCESLVANEQHIILMTLGDTKRKFRFHYILMNKKYLVYNSFKSVSS